MNRYSHMLFGLSAGFAFAFAAAVAVAQEGTQSKSDGHSIRSLTAAPVTGVGKRNIRPIVFDQNGRPVGIAAAAGTCPFPPEPEGSSSCNTNPNDVSPPNTNTICSINDRTFDDGDGPGMIGTQVADTIQFLSPGEVRGLTWEGAWVIDNNPPAFDFGPCDDALVTNDDWDIRYYLNDGPNGEPGTIIAEFLGIGPGVGPGTFTRTLVPGRFMGTGIGQLQMYTMTYTFDLADRFNVESFLAQTYYVEVSPSTNGNCFFCWEVGETAADSFSMQKDLEDPWDLTIDEDADGVPDQENDFDMNQCQDFCSSGPLPNPPEITLETAPAEPFGGVGTSGPVTADECCTFRYTVRNTNGPGAGPVTRFFMAVHRGDDDQPSCGDDLSAITPPPGYTVSICQPWILDSPSGSNWAIYRFEGSSIAEGDQLSGHIKIRVNDNAAKTMDADNIIQPFGIRAWGSQAQTGDTECGTPGNFNPLNNPQNVVWSQGNDGLCTTDGTTDGNPLRPIPAGTVAGKALLALLLIGGGVWLVIRSQRPVTA